MIKTMLPESFLFISICLILTLLLTACGARAQAKENYIIGVVNYAPPLATVFEGFKAGMAEQGYIEGENITYLYHGVTEPNPQAIDREIKNLLDQDVDMFFTMGTLPTLRAKQAVEGAPIPIIFAPVVKPVEEGIVESIRQPGDNVTGIQNGNTLPKAMEWLLKIRPEARKVYVPYHPEDKVAVTSIALLPQTASVLGVELIVDEVYSPEEAMAAIETLPADTVIFLIPTPSLEPLNALIKPAAKRGLIVGSTDLRHLEAGAVVTYGANFSVIGRQAARLADQTLQGVAPGNLPLETAEYFLNINLYAADAANINIPAEIVQQASIVIR
jgi:putative tryptophan/tyrosine transport system substrate-binding protein